MSLKVPFAFAVFYIVVTSLQFIASIDGIIHIFGLHWIFAGFAAALLIFIPAIGPIAGFYGTVVVWKWPLLPVLFLFFWPYFVYFGLLLFGTTKAFMFWKKTFWPFYAANRFKFRHDDIEPEFTVKESASADQEKAETQLINYKDDHSPKY